MNKVIDFVAFAEERQSVRAQSWALPPDKYLLEKFLRVCKNERLKPFYRGLLTPLGGTTLLAQTTSDRALKRSAHVPDVSDVSRQDLGEKFVYTLRAAWYISKLEYDEEMFYEVLKDAGFY